MLVLVRTCARSGGAGRRLFLRPVPAERATKQSAYTARFFAGRSSNSGGRRGGIAQAAQDVVEPAAAETSEVKAEGVVASPSAAPDAAASSDPQAAKGGPGNRSALFALPLYRKPAFPGFYQVVQVSEQEVVDFLSSLRKNGQGEYIGGFMTKEIPEKVAGLIEEEAPSAASTASVGTNQSLRRDSGRVASVSELEEVGTVLQVINLTSYPNIAGGQVVVMPHRRIRRTKAVSSPSPNVALAAVAVEYLEEPVVSKDDEKVKALHLELIATMKELLKTSYLYKEQFEQVIRFFDLDNPLKLADLVAGMSLAHRSELQSVLQENDIVTRLESVLTLVKKDLEGAKLQSHVKSQVEEKITKNQRRQMLMQQMQQIMNELGIEKDEKQTLVIKFRDDVKDKTLPEEANKVLESELTKLQTLETSSSEFNVCRTYLEWLTQLPWSINTEDNKDIKKAESVLNEDHYGLEDVKERILEHIAVSHLKGSVQGKIMCLVGPPGTGKTSVGKSIARALDRKFYRFSVGGLHDVAELRGHRRTYVGAMPGKLIQCLKQVQSSNPVVLIDEIDKLGRDSRGDPSSALLEILDPEQNDTFRDHYLDVPIDLSQVLFVCTANVLDTIPGPLLDRFEIIRISGYVHEEKMAIATNYLIPQIEQTSGVGAENMEIGNDVVAKIITDYAREAGVRQVKKLLEKVTRKVALKMVRKKEETVEKAVITPDNLEKYLGQPVHLSDRLYPFGTPVGVIMGLAWTSQGGATLYIEARGHSRHNVEEPTTDSESGSSPSDANQSSSGGMGGPIKVTGQLGQVMNESSEIALTCARLFIRELNPNNSFLDEAQIHINVPEGAVPKDGPSAGVTMTTALMSLGLGQPIRDNLAMTGELSLTGKVLKVGGIKEKIIAAKREGITTLILPKQNHADYIELKEYLRAGLTAHFVDHYDDVYQLAFDEEKVPPLPRPSLGQPRITVVTAAAEEPATVAGEAKDVQGDTAIPPVAPMTESTGIPATASADSSNDGR